MSIDMVNAYYDYYQSIITTICNYYRKHNISLKSDDVTESVNDTEHNTEPDSDTETNSDTETETFNKIISTKFIDNQIKKKMKKVRKKKTIKNK